MENGKKPSALIAIGIIILLLGNTVILWSKMDHLENELFHVRSSISGLSFGNDTYGMEQRIMEEIRKEASMLESSETALAFRNNKLQVTVSLVPKVLNEGDTFYVVSGYEKVEARKIDEVTFVASLDMNTKKPMELYVVTETQEGTIQEKLPEVYLEQFLSVDLWSTSIHEDRTLQLELSAAMEESSTFLEELDEAKVRVYDRIGKEIMEIPLEEKDPNNSLREEDFGFKYSAFEVILPEELYDMDYFHVKAVLKNYGITMISDEIFSFSKDGSALEGVGGSGFQIFYDN